MEMKTDLKNEALLYDWKKRTFPLGGQENDLHILIFNTLFRFL
jgi:hypothetical protein